MEDDLPGKYTNKGFAVFRRSLSCGSCLCVLVVFQHQEYTGMVPLRPSLQFLRICAADAYGIAC
jgi:hypothetical protein